MTWMTSRWKKILKDDIERMLFGVRLLKQVLYREMSIPLQPNALEKRQEKRKEVIEMRWKAELELAQKKAEAYRKAALESDV